MLKYKFRNNDTGYETISSKSGKVDYLSILIASVIFYILLLATYAMLSLASLVSIAFAAGLVLYHLASRRTHTQHKHGRHLPSIFSLSIIFLPFLIGFVIAIEGYSLWQSPLLIIILAGLSITFWTNMLTVPLSVYSKHKELKEKEPLKYPRLTVLVPAYNEEKVIARTIESLLEEEYPNKEIVVIDDGSTDSTLDVANRYCKKAKVLHKENGGKASAINYGLAFANGEIIVVVDADTIVGRGALKGMARGFRNENVAAVAGDIKVRNRTNWLTWCQALEYVVSIQVVRRAFDFFGAVTVVPGALGAFRRHVFEQSGNYDKDTIVEDFDQTIKALKSGQIVKATTEALAYTEAPNTLRDFYKQRIRWYRGNIQTFLKHSDALTNPRYGVLYKLSFPFMLISMLIIPALGMVVWGSVVFAVLEGQGLLVLMMLILFATLQSLITLLAVRIDGEDLRLVAYSIFFVLGYKQIIDILLIKSALDILFKRRVGWTSVQRIGV